MNPDLRQRLSPYEYVVNFRLRVGAAIAPQDEPCAPCQGRGTADKYGKHCRGACGKKANLNNSHEACKHRFAEFLRSCGFQVQLEVKVGARPKGGGDIIAHIVLVTNKRILWIHFSTMHTTADSYVLEAEDGPTNGLQFKHRLEHALYDAAARILNKITLLVPVTTTGGRRGREFHQLEAFASEWSPLEKWQVKQQ